MRRSPTAGPTIVNTHAHADHTGGNVDFADATAIVAHPNAKAAMEKMEAFRGRTHACSRISWSPIDCRSSRAAIASSCTLRRGHTSGDLVVVFPAKGIAYFGDLFPSKSAPLIDRANGGSGVALPETLAKAVAEITDVARVITGHDNRAPRRGARARRPTSSPLPGR